MLITGGCGFIGTNAAEYFLNSGWEVDVVDNLSRRGSEANNEFLKTLPVASQLSITKLDIVEEAAALAKKISEGGYEAVLHAAAQVAVTSSVADPIHDFRQNALGTLQVLEAVRKSGAKPIFIFTSTNKVYGGMEEVGVVDKGKRYAFQSLPEGVPEHLLLDFHSPYGCSKGAADQYVRDYARIYGLQTTVFRQSCIYGPHQFGMVDQGWVAYLTMQALFDKPITIYGDGKQVRDVLHINDLNRAFEAAIIKREASSGQIFNMGGGSGNTLSLLEFLEFLRHRLDKELNIGFADWRPGDQKVYVSDVVKAKERLGWEPTIDFKEGFEKMLAWMEQNKELLARYV